MWVLRICLLVIPLFCLPGLYRPAHYPKHLVTQVAAFLLLACCALHPKWRLRLRSPFVLSLLLFLAVTAVQALRALNSDEALFSLASQFGYIVLALTAGCLVPSVQMVSLIRFGVAGGVLSATVGILEHLGVGWAMLPSAGRPSATFGFRNVGAMYCAACLLWSGALLVRRGRLDFLLGVAGAGTMLTYVLYARSRGAWLGLLVAGLVGGAWALARRQSEKSGRPGEQLLPGRARRGSIVLVLAVSLTAGFLPPRYTGKGPQRLDEKKSDIVATLASVTTAGGDRRRLDVWRATLDMALANPLIGVGLQNWPAEFPRYDRGKVLDLVSAPKRPHNDFLWALAELGPVGLLALVWLVGAALRTAAGSVRSESWEAGSPALFIALATIALLVHACFSFPRELAAPSVLLWVSLGLIGRLPGRQVKAGLAAR